MVHGWFIDLGNPVVPVLQYLPIGRMTCLGNWNKFSMVSVLMYMVIHYLSKKKKVYGYTLNRTYGEACPNGYLITCIFLSYYVV